LHSPLLAVEHVAEDHNRDPGDKLNCHKKKGDFQNGFNCVLLKVSRHKKSAMPEDMTPSPIIGG